MSSLKPPKKQRVTKRNHKQLNFEATIKYIESFYIKAKSIAEVFKSHGVTIQALNAIFEAKKLTVFKTDYEKASFPKLNDAMNSARELLISQAEQMDSKIVPLELIKQIIDQSVDQLKQVWNQKQKANDTK